MREHIHIRNLGPIKDIRLEDIKPFTVLIGDSGSGKSTFLKALALCRWIWKMCNIREYRRLSNIQGPPFDLDMEAYLSNCGFTGLGFITEKTEIIYGFDSVTLAIRGKRLDAGRVHIPKCELAFDKISFIGELRGTIPSFPNSPSQRPNLGFYFDEVFNDFDRATRLIREMDIPVLGVHFTVEKVMHQERYFLQPIGNSLPHFKTELRDGSSGMQSAIPLLVILKHFSRDFDFADAFNRSVLEYLRKTDRLTEFKPVANLSDLSKRIYVHIEEPEIGLFPDAQCGLMNELVQQCFIGNTNPLSVALATHSPYILAHLNNMLQAGQIPKIQERADSPPPLAPGFTAAYEIADGTCVPLLDEATGLIRENAIDNCSSKIYSQFDRLLDDGTP